MLSCMHRMKRTNKSAPDPLLKEFTNLKKDYYKSGHDQGYNMDAYNNGCDSIGMVENFHVSADAQTERRGLENARGVHTKESENV